MNYRRSKLRGIRTRHDGDGGGVNDGRWIAS